MIRRMPGPITVQHTKTSESITKEPTGMLVQPDRRDADLLSSSAT